MRSIEARYNLITDPCLSSYTRFARAVKGQGFNEESISRWFSKLVEKGDYLPNQRKTLISQLTTLSKRAEEHRFRGVNGKKQGVKTKSR